MMLTPEQVRNAYLNAKCGGYGPVRQEVYLARIKCLLDRIDEIERENDYLSHINAIDAEAVPAPPQTHAEVKTQVDMS